MVQPRKLNFLTCTQWHFDNFIPLLVASVFLYLSSVDVNLCSVILHFVMNLFIPPNHVI